VARLLALLLGCSLAGVILAVGLWIRFRPGPAHEIDLHVVDERGLPVEQFGWHVIDWTPGATMDTYVREAAHPGGIATARVPEHEVRLEIEAPGFHYTQAGPVGPNSFPTRLDVVVPDLGVVAGTVTFGGRPVGGATVMLLDSKIDVAADVPSGLLAGYHDHITTTDASGAFRIKSEYSLMDYYVRASRDGHSPGIAGPIHVGDPPVEISLRDGGSIEGRVRLAGGKEPDGIEIELYRTDAPEWEIDAYGHFVARSLDGGRFSYEHVDPGSWLVRLKDPKATRYGEQQCPLDQVPFIVEVAEHEQAKLEMDLSQPAARLEGHARLNGKPWSHAWACLYTMGEQALTLDWAPADRDGRWTLRARTPGTYRLVVDGNHQHAVEPREISDVVVLSRDGTPWDHEFTWSRSDPDRIALNQKR
jgi:hypothetical protein